MLTKAIEVQRYIKASAGRAGLSVVFEPTNRPRHDGNVIYLPQITSETTEQELKQLMASTDHEVAHDRYSSFDVLRELMELDPNSLLKFVWNFIEDSRVNNIEAREYCGFRENMDACEAQLVEGIIKNCKERDKDSLMGQLMGALLRWETEISKAAFPLAEAAVGDYVPNKEIYDVLVAHSSRLVDTHFILGKEEGTRSTYQLAYDILTALREDMSEELKEAVAKARKSSAESGDEEGEGDGEGTGKATDSGPSTSDSPAEDDGEYKIVTVKITEEDLAELSISTTTEMGHVGINFEPVVLSKWHNWDMTDMDKFLVVNYPKKTGHYKYFEKWPGFKTAYMMRCGKLLVTNENFAQQVRRLVQIRAKVQTQYGVRKGKLDQSRLSRICYNAPGFSERVFKNRIENTTLDAAVTVLVDMSGSMGGDKFFFAYASAMLMNEVCHTLGIPLEILGFTDDYDPTTYGNVAPLMFIYKAFSDLHVADEDLELAFSCSSRHMHGNPDGENIIWAHDRLIRRKERKKLLLVMSDGCPAASKSSCGLEEFTLKAIKEIEASKHVDIYGLGLCNNSVTDYYKANSVVHTPQDIPAKLLHLLEKRILS